MKHVKYIGASQDQINWGNNDDPRGLLHEGNIYTVKRTEVHSWHTKIELMEHPGKVFNDASFDYVQP